MLEMTIEESMPDYLEDVTRRLSSSTAGSYRNVIDRFSDFLREEQGVSIDEVSTSEVSEEWAVGFIESIAELAPSTKGVYRAAVVGWYRFIEDRRLADVDVQTIQDTLRVYLRQEVPKPSPPPAHYDISRLVNYVMELGRSSESSGERARLRELRDRALIITLADTGMDVNVAYQMRRGDVDWKNTRFVPTIKGSRESVDCSPRVLRVLSEYLDARSHLDDATGRRRASLPLFARHDRKTEGQVVGFRYENVRKIVKTRAKEALGARYDGSITPKSLRHYFVSSLSEPFSLLHRRIVERCQVLFENGQYDQAIFVAMRTVEEEVRSRISADPSDLGVALITKAFRPDSPLIKVSSVPAEQESAYYLFRGAIGSFKNPLSHRSLGICDPTRTFECLAFASLLMRMLDETA